MTRFPERHATIDQVVEACELYWLLNRVPRGQVDEMTLELRDHLNAAVADDKSIADVVGANLEAFAAAWQEAYQRPNAAGDALRTVGIGLACAPVAILTFQHLAHRAWAFPVSWLDLVWVLVVALVPLAVLQPGVLVAALHSRSLRLLAWLLITLTVVVPALLSLLWPQPQFLWTWPLTLVIVLGASLLTVAFLQRDPTRRRPAPVKPGARLTWWQTLLGLGAASAISLLLWFSAGTAVWNAITATLVAASLYSLWFTLLGHLVWAGPPAHSDHT